MQPGVDCSSHEFIVNIKHAVEFRNILVNNATSSIICILPVVLILMNARRLSLEVLHETLNYFT